MIRNAEPRNDVARRATRTRGRTRERNRDETEKDERARRARTNCDDHERTRRRCVTRGDPNRFRFRAIGSRLKIRTTPSCLRFAATYDGSEPARSRSRLVLKRKCAVFHRRHTDQIFMKKLGFERNAHFQNVTFLQNPGPILPRETARRFVVLAADLQRRKHAPHSSANARTRPWTQKRSG